MLVEDLLDIGIDLILQFLKDLDSAGYRSPGPSAGSNSYE